MKTINALALVAFVITVTAYFMSAGTISAPAETGGDRTVVDMLPAKRQAAPAPAEIKPVAPVKVKAEPNPMLEAVTSGNVCAVEALKAKNYNPTINDFAALAATISPGPALAEFLSANGPVMTNSEPKKRYTSKAARLIWALRLSGMNLVGSVPENLPEARKQLLELEKEDPANGAIPLLRLGVEKKMNLDSQVLAETEARISDSSDFTTYLEELGAEFSKARWESPAIYRLVEHVDYFVLPSPNLYEGISALQSSTTLSEDSRNRIVSLMKERALRSTEPIIGRDFNADIYENARALAKDYDSRSIYQISSDRAAALGVEPINFPSLKSGTECDSRAYEDYFYANRGKH